jgi:hypothetical protein
VANFGTPDTPRLLGKMERKRGKKNNRSLRGLTASPRAAGVRTEPLPAPGTQTPGTLPVACGKFATTEDPSFWGEGLFGVLFCLNALCGPYLGPHKRLSLCSRLGTGAQCIKKKISFGTFRCFARDGTRTIVSGAARRAKVLLSAPSNSQPFARHVRRRCIREFVRAG